MLIDWFTVLAQGVNFLILVWLLKRFLYGPILRAMDERQARLIEQQRQAETARVAAEEEGRRQAAAVAEYENHRHERLAALQAEIDQRRQGLFEALREEIGALRVRWRADLDREIDLSRDRISTLIRSEVFSLSRMVLAGLADADLESRAAAVLLQRLQAMASEEASRPAPIGRDPITTDPSARLLVRSAFPLSPEFREKISAILVSGPSMAEFQVSPDLLCGFELIGEKVKISWNLTDELATLEERLHEIILPETSSAPAA